MSDFEKVLSKAATDEKFRNKLTTDPAGALKDAGVQSTPEKVEAIQYAKQSLAEAHKKFGGQPLTD